jgi:hypothetical protein
MALSGKVETSAYEFKNGTRTVILEWTATQDFEANTTTIKWKAVGGGTYTSNPVVCELRVTIDGDVEFYKEPVSGNRVNCSIGTVLATGTKVIEHNSDGTRNVSMTIEAGIYEWKINKTGSANFTLSPIPKPSTVSATNANIGEKTTIVVVQKGQPTTHSIRYEFGLLSGYLTADGGISDSEAVFSATTILWSVPESFYSQIPNAKSGTCKLTIKTYSGTYQIGDSKTGTFVATASKESSSPVVSGNVVDSNDATKQLTGDENKLVRYHSTALCTITATPRNGSSISDKKIGGVSVSGTTREIEEIEIDSIDFRAIDSRGYESTESVAISLIPYIILTNNPVGQRTDPTSGNAKLTVKGDYFNNSFGLEQNSISVKYRVRPVGGEYGEYSVADVVVFESSYSAEADLSGLDYRKQYEIEVIVSDKLEEITKTAKINKGVPVCDWGENDFRFNVPVEFSPASFGTEPPAEAKIGQAYFRKNADGTYSILIYDGESW